MLTKYLEAAMRLAHYEITSKLGGITGPRHRKPQSLGQLAVLAVQGEVAHAETPVLVQGLRLGRLEASGTSVEPGRRGHETRDVGLLEGSETGVTSLRGLVAAGRSALDYVL